MRAGPLLDCSDDAPIVTKCICDWAARVTSQQRAFDCTEWTDAETGYVSAPGGSARPGEHNACIVRISSNLPTGTRP